MSYSRIDYPFDVNEVIDRAYQAGVMQMICIGTCDDSVRRAIDLASIHDSLFATIGLHPHYAKNGLDSIIRSKKDFVNNKKIVAIGEIGLDYYYDYSPRDTQIKIFQEQIEMALKLDLPIIFHVRDAYDDFWSIIDNFRFASKRLRGVLHCFTDASSNIQKGIKRGLYVGVNGISTFTKDESQKVMFATIPIDKLLLETDAPFLTPYPLCGKIKVNEPAFIKEIAEYNSAIRQISFEELANTTTANARALFNL